MRARTIAVAALLVVVIALAASLGQRGRFAREAFAPGDRVRLDRASERAAGLTGTVTLPPLPVLGDESGWEGHVRRLPAGPAFWVTLDRPLGRAGAPPLRGLEVSGAHLSRSR